MVTDVTDKDYSYIAKAMLKNEDLGLFEMEGEFAVDELGWVAVYPSESPMFVRSRFVSFGGFLPG